MMEDIIYAKSDFLYRKFKELVGQMNQTDIDRFLKFMNSRDDDQTMNRLKEEVKLQLYNNRKLPQFIRKRMEQLERMQLTNKITKESTKLDKIMSMLEEFDDDKLDKMERLLNSIKY
jgi:Fe-S-cluster formation regulator IscX/YfhJ